MQTWNIWCEGYAATGEWGLAWHVGTVDAEDFQEACDKIAFEKKWDQYYDASRRTYWGCRLFDNEADARKFVG